MPAAEPIGDRPRLYVTLLSHLDTQWRWTVRDTIARFLPATVRENEAALARHPSLVLSFEGAFRYQLLAEYHPELLAIVRRLVGEGRWFPAGAALESFDANLPAPESLVRQILYGVRWFERELGLAGRDLFLPDCFGFPASLPTLAAHCGIAGFSTQKLSRRELMRSAYGIPFAVGLWTAADGAELPAALDPGEYSGRVGGDLSLDLAWRARFAALGEAARPQRLLFYVGLGDQGGAVPEASLANLEHSTRGGGPIEVRSAPSAALFTDLTAEERSRLPRYRGELLLRLHATGCYTAQATMKRWNRANERLAFAAEAAATVAAWLGARPYPRAALELAWTRFLAHQMHDDLTGTSIPAAYRISWNDETIAANRFAAVLRDSCGAVAAALDTRAEGAPIVVFHPGQRRREVVVELARDAGEGEGAEPVVVGSEGPLPTQAGVDADGRAVSLFLASLPALGFAVFDLRARQRDATSPAGVGELEISERELANRRYRARFDDAGRLASLFDRRLERELLGAPLELELLADRSTKYPAWEIHWHDLARAPRERVSEVESIRVLERGPARATLEIRRRAAGSTFRELWRLHAGAFGEALEVVLDLDWRTPGTLLKYAFPLAAAHRFATYDLGAGAIERPIASERLYEVPAQGWVDLTDEERGFGVTLACDSRQGWDQPAADRLRLTLLHSPATGRRFRHQARQDFGRHRLTIALAGHAGGWREAEAWRLAERFDRAPIPFAGAAGGDGPLGRRLGFLDLGAQPVELLAVKRAEASDELVLRVSERSGSPVNLAPRFAAAVRSRAIDGLEEPAGRDDPWSLHPNGLIAIACELAPPPSPVAPPRFAALALPWNRRGFSRQGEAGGAGFDDRGNCFPRELLSSPLVENGIAFDLDQVGSGADVVVACGQRLDLAAGFDEVWLLGASIGGDLEVGFGGGRSQRRAPLPDWRAPLGAWDRERWTALGRRRVAGFRKQVALAWVAGHLHDRRGRDRIYEPGCLFLVRLPVAREARTLELPDDPRARFVAAAQVTGAGSQLVPLAPLVLDHGGGARASLGRRKR
ncbi:MAG: glycoside hydrolase family 38 C-terminal domain-containing protein [Thermoanaerobaculia bacterium]